jgi:hypothetical protein
VISLFIFFWFAPTNTAKVIAFIIPPLAILCGINYWLLIRRHGWYLQKFFRFFSILAALLAFSAVAFYLLPETWISHTQFIVGDLSFRKDFVFGVCEATLGFCVALCAIILSRKSLHLYVHILLLATSVTLSFWALQVPYRISKSQKIDLGEAFAKAIRTDLKLSGNEPLPLSVTVFKGPHIRGLYAPCIYMGGKVKKIYSIASLPDTPETIYMIATQFPASKNRTWEYVTSKEKPLIYKKTRLYILKGKSTKVEQLKNNEAS